MAMTTSNYSLASDPNSGSAKVMTSSPFDAASLAFDRATLLAHRVMQLTDRLCGQVPQEAHHGGAERPANGVFDGMRANAEQATSVVEEALNSLDRIERQLP